MASIKGQLDQLARRREENIQITHIRYAVERFLHRLSKSSHQSRFVLKGAMLFTVWGENRHRPTRDLDLLGRGENSEQILRETLNEILRAEVEPDGLDFVSGPFRVEALHEGQDYEGLRVSIVAKLDRTRIPLQLDIAFGQAVEPDAEAAEYPGLLELPGPRVLMYPKEVVIAEKFQALVVLGMGNNRLKDFYDLAFLSDTFNFSASRMAQALRATFARRGTKLPEETPLALTASYFEDPTRRQDWRAFLNRAGLQEKDFTLEAACSKIERFVMPAVRWAQAGDAEEVSWTKSGGWSRSKI